ncbi:MAG: hypothetical protein ACXVRU_10825 [Gaiellaceae bacterium]
MKAIVAAAAIAAVLLTGCGRQANGSGGLVSNSDIRLAAVQRYHMDAHAAESGDVMSALRRLHEDASKVSDPSNALERMKADAAG